MLRWIQKLFGPKEQSVRLPIHDEILGDVTYNPKLKHWEVRIQSSVKIIDLVMAGDQAPDPKLIAHARDISKSISGFEKMLLDFLGIEAANSTDEGDEIRALELEEIALHWPDRPEDGMIYFKGPDEIKMWRCDYVDRKPRNLGWDD